MAAALYPEGGAPPSRSASSGAANRVTAPTGLGNTVDSLRCAYGSSFQAALDDTVVSSPWPKALRDNCRLPRGRNLGALYYYYFLVGC